MYIKSEQDILNEETRAKLIEGFNDSANQRRKDDAFKAYECLKDKTINYVLELLMKQFDSSTVVEMQYAMSNISILRKVIDKLAKVYTNGVKRTMKNKSDTQAVESAAEYIDMNAAMKKANKYFRTFKNTLAFVRPMKNGEQYDIKVEVLPPFKYDAVENADNPEVPLAIVLSDYVTSRKPLYALGDAAYAGRSGVRESHQIDAPVQQTPGTGITGNDGGSEDKREYIWWTKSYHFTTNAKGVILNTSEDGEEAGTDNPIKELPFVNFAGEQDGCFWAEGGSDLVDTGVKINVDISNIKHIGNTQGYGQLYMTGKDLPKSFKVGPNHCVQLEQVDKDAPTPTIGYLTSNPPLADLKSIIEMQVALMLTTNNLSTSGFSVSLQGGKDFASGIAMMIDKSESIEDIEEQAEVFIKREPQVWCLVYAWLTAYKSSGKLTEEANALKIVKTPEEVSVSFPSPKPVVSESEELDVLQKRKDLGLNTQVELLMRDDPSLTEADAQAKMEKIQAEKLNNAAAVVGAVGAAVAPGKDVNGNQSQKSDGFQQPDNNNAGPSGGSKAAGSGEEPNQE